MTTRREQLYVGLICLALALSAWALHLAWPTAACSVCEAEAPPLTDEERELVIPFEWEPYQPEPDELDPPANHYEAWHEADPLGI